MSVGLGLRAYHYLRNPSMWHDEAALVLNVLHKNFGELLGPLFFAEAAPPLFLWAERAVALTLGEGTHALRLISFLASCLALVLFVSVARRMLSPAAVPWAVLLFACSDQLLWHAAEAKPYSSDVLAAVLLLAVYWSTLEWPIERRLLLFALPAPAVIFLAYPGCFLYGGLLLALLPAVWQSRRWTAWLAGSVLALTVLTAFALLLAGPVRAQRCAPMDQCWAEYFPSWDRPLMVPLWAVYGALNAARYCCEPVGNVLIGVLAVGAASLWRQGQRAVVVLLLAPVGLALLASFLRGYPFGGARTIVYASPAVILLLAAGLPPSLAWLRSRSRLAAAALIVLFLAPAGLACRNALVPEARTDCAGAAAYILTHCRPNDRIISDAWEACYYFRRLGTAFVPTWDIACWPRPPYPTPSASAAPLSPEELVRLPGARLWAVFTGATVGERRQRFDKLDPKAWRVLEQRELERTTVLLLERSP
ncbi:MAG TPA: hypothetical protein VNK04_25060 [Gemmataceae bacterium]|nr:hypothetical protein [Gemmataceae bacterium]